MGRSLFEVIQDLHMACSGSMEMPEAQMKELYDHLRYKVAGWKESSRRYQVYDSIVLTLVKQVMFEYEQQHIYTQPETPSTPRSLIAPAHKLDPDPDGVAGHGGYAWPAKI